MLIISFFCTCICLLLLEEAPFDPNDYPFLGVVIIIVTIAIFLFFGIQFTEVIFVKYYKRPLIVHWYTRLQEMPKSMEQYLLGTVPFYIQLDSRHKKYFRHRVMVFIQETTIEGREGFVVDDSIRIAIAALAIQMTFGMRAYILPYLNTIIIYPSSFYSILNQEEHRGEFNPRLKTIVLSWEHFLQGNAVKDGVNLGIHELTHVIHFGSIKSNDISSEIFYDTFLSLEGYLGDTVIREQLVAANILRPYAYTDKFEFVAVLVEVFMESPEKLRSLFPELYQLVKQMLNYRY